MDRTILRSVPTARPPAYLFDAFRLDCEQRTLRRDGAVVPLAPKLFDVLLTLVDANGRLVTRDELAERVWGRPVGDGTLSQHVFLLRRALGDETNEHRFLLTVPGKGYRFLAPVRVEPATGPQSRLEPGPSVSRFLISERFLPLRYYCEGSFMVLQRSDSALRAAVEAFEAALAADPFYAPAHVGLALAHCMLGEYLFVPPAEAFSTAKRSALRALELDRSSAVAHAVLGEILIFSDRDWAGAFRELNLATQLDPHSTIPRNQRAWALLWIGEPEEALLDIQEALSLDPGSILLRNTLSFILIHLGEYDRAVAQLEGIRQQQPDWTLADFNLAMAHIGAGRPHAAISVLRRRQRTEFAQQAIALLGHAYGAAGNEESALELVAQLRGLSTGRYITEYNYAIIYAGMGRTADALDALDRCLEENGAWLAFLRTCPLLRRLRGEPRFESILRRSGHPITECA